MSRLITASLIGSVDWFLSSPPSWKERAYTSLSNQLNRIWDGGSLATKKGIDFENDIYAILDGKAGVDWSTLSKEFIIFLNACKGGQFQRKNKMYVDIGDDEYCLYAKEDVFFPKKIIDIKTSGKWGGRSKYLGTYQHKLYCLVEEIPDFEYLIAIWKEADTESRKIKEVHQLSYHCDDFDELKKDVLEKVANTISVLQSDDELWKAYTTKFSRY